jgi:sRNA-binding carbon storage regulator CsrA
MLVLTRRPGQGLWIGLDERIEPTMTAMELFSGGRIQLVVAEVRGVQVKLGIRADPRLVILREELCDDGVAWYR